VNKQAANVLELIEFFATHQRPASLAEIARHLGWPRSSTFKLLGTLTSRGYLYEPRARAGYYPAPLLAHLVNQIEQAQPVPKDVHELLESLVEETGETAVLAAASGSHAVFVDTVESPSSVRYTAHVGKRVPLHVTATGRALLSQMDEKSRHALLKKAAYMAHTDTTLLSAEAVEQEIQVSLGRGWFRGNAEYSADLGGVALALEIDERGFTLLVAGPTSRVGHRLPELAGILQRHVAQYLRRHARAG